jgi:arylformamidase
MTVHDISLPISETLVTWPGDPKVRISRVFDLAAGDQATVSKIGMGVHTGTHIDAPAHFIAGGATIEHIDLNVLVGRALVVDLGDVHAITAEVLEKLSIPPTVERLLFRTGNSRFWAAGTAEFQKNFVAISEDGAHWLAAGKIRLVGIDYLSVAPFSEPAPTHNILLANNIVVVEGLNLADVAAGFYQLVCLPLKITGCEAAPARAILVDGDDEAGNY